LFQKRRFDAFAEIFDRLNRLDPPRITFALSVFFANILDGVQDRSELIRRRREYRSLSFDIGGIMDAHAALLLINFTTFSVCAGFPKCRRHHKFTV